MVINQKREHCNTVPKKWPLEMMGTKRFSTLQRRGLRRFPFPFLVHFLKHYNNKKRGLNLGHPPQIFTRIKKRDDFAHLRRWLLHVSAILEQQPDDPVISRDLDSRGYVLVVVGGVGCQWACLWKVERAKRFISTKSYRLNNRWPGWCVRLRWVNNSVILLSPYFPDFPC